MSEKYSRMEAIRLLISSQEIHNQAELQQALQDKGFNATQATISRNLKQMKVTKVLNNDGRSMFVLPNNTQYRRVRDIKPEDLMNGNGIISTEFSGNIGVIRTRPGFASSLAYDIDNAELPSILGTVAGDDTILIVLKEGVRREDVYRQLLQLTSHFFSRLQ